MKKLIPYILVGLLVVGFVGLIGYLKVSNSKPESVPKETETYFDDNANVMYFYSPNCVHCIKEKKVLSELAVEGFRVKPMNTLDNPDVANQYKIKATPEFISQKDGARLEGYQEKEALKSWMEKHQ